MAEQNGALGPHDEGAAPHTPGRPRRPGTDEAILKATLDLIAEGGIPAATIAGVSARTGVARGSIYLRWPNRDALVAAAIRRAIGRQPFDLSGDLVVDIHRGAEQARAILSERLFRTVLPPLIARLLADGQASITYDALFPNRRRLADEYRALAATSGFRDDVDPFLPFDMVIGAMLNRLLATGRPPSRAVALETADAVLASVRIDRRVAPSRGSTRRPR